MRSSKFSPRLDVDAKLVLVELFLIFVSALHDLIAGAWLILKCIIFFNCIIDLKEMLKLQQSKIFLFLIYSLCRIAWICKVDPCNPFTCFHSSTFPSCSFSAEECFCLLHEHLTWNAALYVYGNLAWNVESLFLRWLSNFGCEVAVKQH